MTLGTLDLISDSYGVTSFDLSQPGRIRLRVDVAADSTGSAVDLFRGVRTQLNNAERASQPASGQAWVVLSMQADATSEVIEFPVKRGTVQPPTLTGGRNGSADAFSFGWIPGVFIELETLPYGLGEAIEYGPFTVTGADPTFHIDGVPGDEPALAEFRITDNSTGVVVNRLRWACRSLPAMDDGDYEAVLPFNETDESVADTFTGGIESISASSTWQTIGSVSKAASAYNGGLFDAWGRVRDATAALGVPGGVEATAGESIEKVQSRGFGTSGSSADVSWLSPTTAGNLLVLAVRISSNHTINTPAGWTAGPSVGSGPRAALFYKADAPSESGTVTVTFSGSASNIRLYIAEFRGIATSSPVDVTATNTVTNSTNGATGTTSTTAQANALAVALWSTSASTGGSITLPSGWSVLNDSGSPEGNAGFKVLTATGTQSGTATHSSSLTDWANLIVVFKGLVTAPGAVPANGYTARVVAVDSSGGLSAPSDAATTTLTGTGAIFIEWDAASGPVDQYRVYLLPDDGDYVYFDTGSTAASYTITSIASPDGTADPPSASTITPGAFRVRLGPESGTTHDLVSGPLYATVANSEWEPLYMGRTYLSPTETPLIATQTGWKLDVQGRADASTQMDVDALILMPADEQQVDVRYAPGDLSTARTWVVGTTPDMRSYGFLQDGSGDEAGRLLAVGRALMGPGDTTCVLIPTVEGGVWNVDDVELSVTVHVRPVYMWLAGSA